jgi:UDP-glucose 4-epimerase
MRVLITGGCGFIGANLAYGLLEENHDVYVVDNLSNGNINRIENFKKKVNFFEGDICDDEIINNLASKVDIIFHLAAQVSVYDSIKNPIKDAKTNILGTINILQASLEQNIKKLILFSSAAIYGDPVKLPIKENHAKNPKSPYGFSKLVSECYAIFYRDNYPVNITVIRPFNVYGPMQNPNSPYSGVISIFIKHALENKDLIIYGDGKQTRDFIFIDDLIRLCTLILNDKRADNKIFNAATGNETTINDLAQEIIQLLNSKSKIKYEAARKGDIKRSFADISYINQEIDFIPKYSIEEGLKKFIDYQKKHK